MTATIAYASPANAWIHGEYRGAARTPSFHDRITADGSSGYRAEPGRYHLYAGWFCPWSQRVTIQLALNRLDDIVTVSYVHGQRDARGWAFREETGADPVNGFTLLRQAYEATESAFDGHVSVPVLWDRHTSRVVSNDYRTIGLDLATQFRAWADPIVDTYPARLRDQIDELDAWLGPAVNYAVGRAPYDPPTAARMVSAFRRLDGRLAGRDHLLGDVLTEADVRLWVTLVRYDAGPNAHGRIGPHLEAFPNLWSYARRLYRQPAFRSTTDFASFTAPLAAVSAWQTAGWR